VTDTWVKRLPDRWLCGGCGGINPVLKPGRKRPEALVFCLVCGMKWRPVAL
jgi:hypothetical protein